jgi:hypothetical protein
MTELLDGHGRPLLSPKMSMVRLPGGEVMNAAVAPLDCEWALAAVLVTSMEGEPIAPMMAMLGIPADHIEMVERSDVAAPIITLRADPGGPDGQHVFLSPASAIAILCDTLRAQGVTLPESYPTRRVINDTPVELDHDDD